MCGIFGMLAPNTDEEFRNKLLFNLTRETESRGEDATGLAFVEEDELQIYKAPEKGSRFVFGEQFEEVSDRNPPFIMGHCRKKTVGDPKKNENNHPLYSPDSNIAVIHNGGVMDHAWRALNDEGENPYIWRPFTADVDSEAVLRVIETLLYIPREEDGTINPERVADTPKDDWERNVDLMTAIDDAVYNLSGPQACALMDKDEPNVIYAWRTEGRPLYMSYIPEHECIVFSSTKEILDRSLQEKEVSFFFDFFTVEKSLPAPKYLGRELNKNTLVRIEWVGGDKQFDIVTRELTPNGAFSFKSSGKFKV